MSKRHHGTSLDSFLEGEGMFEESQAFAIKEVIVWQLTEAMGKQSLSTARLATLLKTSRSQVDRLFDPTRDVTLSTLQRACETARIWRVFTSSIRPASNMAWTRWLMRS